MSKYTFGRSSLGSWGGGGSATPRGANLVCRFDRRQHFVFEYNHAVFVVYRSAPDHALYVLADPAEPPDVAGDQSEGDRVQALSCRRVRT